MAKSKKQYNTKKIVTAAFIGVVTVFCLFLAAMLLFNSFYQEVYDMPRVRRGEVDFTGYYTQDIERKVSYNLAGEWEFFYNRWIVTDGDEDAVPDGLIDVPSRWTYKNYGGKILSAEGYASYRLTIKNLRAGDTLYIYRTNFDGAYRVFINGMLSTECGVVSKDSGKTRGGSPKKIALGVSDGSDITVVLELSANSTGGLNAAPWLKADVGVAGVWSSIYDLRMAMLGVVCAAFLFILLMTVGFYRYEKTVAFAVLSALLMLHFIFSKDIANTIGVRYGIASVFGLISGVGIIAAYAVVFARLGAPMGKRAGLALLFAEIGCLILYCIWRTTDLAFVPLCVGLMLALAPLYPLLDSRKIGVGFKATYTVLYLLSLGVMLFEAADGTGALKFGTESIFSFVMVFIILAAAVTVCLRISATARVIMRTNELEQELFKLKQDILQYKIKPHFVFNSLTAIQSLYRKSVGEGEAQLLRFAEYLRTNIDAKGDALITFDEEVGHVLNYFELENLRRGGTLNLLLDVKATDFCVPMLSVQPFVENAVRHAKTDERADGYISLSSEKMADGQIILRVCDNGVGFDLASTETRVGINNACARFEGLLGAHVEISSAVGRGTEITVVIPQSLDAIGE